MQNIQNEFVMENKKSKLVDVSKLLSDELDGGRRIVKNMKNEVNRKCYGSSMFAKSNDKQIKKILDRFRIVGVNFTEPIKFKKKPYYQCRYSNYIRMASATFTFFIPSIVIKKYQRIVGRSVKSGDRWLLKVNNEYLLMVKLSKYAKGFSFILGEQVTEKIGIKRSSQTEFQILKVAKYEDIKEKIIKEYVSGTDVKNLETKYPLSYCAICKILKTENVHLRTISEQEVIKYHGCLPTINNKLSSNKLALIFAIFGDNAGNVNGNRFIVGIIAGKDLDFALAFIRAFKEEYGISPPIRQSNGCYKAVMANKSIFHDLRQYAVFGCYSWKLRNNAWEMIKKINKIELGNAVRFFWEAEGCPIPKSKTIEATSVNLYGLKQIQKIMQELGIKTTITGPNFVASPSGLYTIRVSGKENIKSFKELTNFITSRKQEKIDKTLGSYKKKTTLTFKV